MAQEYQIVRIIPDKKGKGGDKSGMTTHLGVVDIYSNTNALLYAGRWRSMQGSAAYTTGNQNNANATQCKSIHVYYKYSTLPTTEPTIYLLGHHYEFYTGNYNVIWDYTDSNYAQCFKGSTTYTGIFSNGSTLVTNILPANISAWMTQSKVFVMVPTGVGSGWSPYKSHIASVFNSGAFYLPANYVGTSGTYSFVISRFVSAQGTMTTGIAKFVNVRNRCFIAWGNTTWGNLIFDDSFVEADGLHHAIVYSMGCPAPVNNITYTLTTPYSGTCGLTGDQNFNTVAGCFFYSAVPAITSSLQINVAGFTATVLNIGSGSWQESITISADKLTYTVGAGNPYANGNIVYRPFPTTIFGIMTTMSITAGNITGLMDRQNAAGAYTNCQSGYGPNHTVTFTPAYTGGPIYNVPFTMNTGAMNWIGSGPIYAVARYNPTTGHVSDIGPQLQVVEKDQNISQVNLQIPVDGVASDYYLAGYTKLIVFRTALSTSGGGALLPIGDPTVDYLTDNIIGSGGCAGYRGTIDNYSTLGPMVPSTVAFTDNFPDTSLLLNSTFIAPQAGENAPPPTFVQMAYWDDVVWGVDVTDQSAIRYSVYSGDRHFSFGVTQESFPSGNQLRIPAEDGRVLGMRPVGGSLIISTQRYAYAITGTQGAYGLVRFCTAMSGVTHERFCEWAGDAGEASDRLAFIGNDGKFYRFTPNYGTEVISAPIATSISSAFDTWGLSRMAIHQLISKNYRLFIFGLVGQTWALDYENGTWHKFYLDNLQEAFTQIYSGAAAPIQLYGYQGALYKWFDPSTAVYLTTMLTTFPVDCGSPESFKELSGVRVWVSDPLNPPQLAAFSDEGVVLAGESRSHGLTLATEPDPVRSPQNIGSSGWKLDAGNATAMVGYFNPPFVGHRFYATLQWGSTSVGDIYEIDFLFRATEGPPTG